MVGIEFACIESMMNDTIACLEGLVELTEDDFNTSFGKKAFLTIKSLTQEGKPIDSIILKAQVNSKKFSDDYDDYADTFTVNHEKYRQYFSELRDTSKRTKAKKIYQGALEGLEGKKEPVENIIKEVGSATIDLLVEKGQSGFTSFEDEAIKIRKILENPRLAPPPLFTTGIKGIDSKINIVPGTFIVIASRPSMGKTALMLQIAGNAAITEEVDSLIFSIEMTKDQLANRLISNITGIHYWKLDKRGKGFTEKDWQLYEKYEAKLERGKRKLQINDNPMMDVQTLCAITRQEKIKNPNIKAVFIDYLQLMHRSEDLNLEMGQISRSLKILARELGICTIALSQLTRECDKREDKRPMLSDLRNSGAIEQDADIVWFPYRNYMYTKDDREKNNCEHILGKNRNGETGTIFGGFDGAIQRYTEIP